jgi:pilus assembly protein CpaF
VTVEDAVHQELAASADPIVPSSQRIASLVRQADPLLPADAVRSVVERVSARLGGLGPLDPLLADPSVTDVLVNGPGAVWVERGGALSITDVALDRPTLDLLIERVLAPLGRRVDPVHPTADARLADGSRVHVVVPPLAVDGPYLTIRRFRARPGELHEVAPPGTAALLRWAVTGRANLIVVGSTGSGKTTLLNALAASLPEHERIVTVEDAAELRLPGPHVIRLETRPGSVEGVEAVAARELVRNALRMRPDRILVGEVRGAEALDLVQAMNTGHDGSLSTVHANGCADALRRLETLVLLAGIGLPIEAVRDHLAAAIDLVVHIGRVPGGGRRVLSVAEVVPPELEDATAARRRGGAWRGSVPVRVLADAQGVVARPTRGWRAAHPAPPPPPERGGA